MSAETMRFKECGGVLLAVHSADTPNDQEWTTFIEYCLRFPDCNKTLVYTLGGGPNPKQRKELNDRYVSRHKARGKYLVAVMSDSPGIRFVVSALNLFNQDAASFAYDNGAGMPAALKHLGITESGTAGRITLEVRKMALELKK